MSYFWRKSIAGIIETEDLLKICCDISISFLKQPSLITYLDRPDKQVIENIPVAIKDTVVSLRTA